MQDFYTIFIAITVLFVIYFKWSHNYWKRQGIPQLETKPILGAAFDTISRRENIAMTYSRLRSIIKSKRWKHGGIYFFASPIYMPVDLDIIKSIFVKDCDHFMDRDNYVNEKDDPLTNMLLFQAGDKWKKMRRQITPTFTSAQLKWMFDILLKCNDYIPIILDEHVDGLPVNIKETFERLTMDTIGNCAFGIDCNTLKEPEANFRTYGKRVVDGGLRALVNLIVFSLIPFDVLRFFGFRVLSKDVEDFFMGIVKETVKLREEKKVYRKDFMQLLVEIKEKEGFSVENIAAQAFLFFIAAFDTSSNTLAYAMLELAQNEVIQNKLRKEIVTVLKKHEGNVTYEAIQEMGYLDCAVAETLRKYSPAAQINRKCTLDYKIPGTNLMLKKGTKVIVSVYGIHHDSDYYPQPEIFNPDRFSEENRRKIPPLAFIPFGLGQRSCIASRFARMQIKVTICNLLKRYAFTLNEKTITPIKNSPSSLILSPIGGVWLN
ncbi:cytochrome p450, partial [Rhyzopertha dominica]